MGSAALRTRPPAGPASAGSAASVTAAAVARATARPIDLEDGRESWKDDKGTPGGELEAVPPVVPGTEPVYPRAPRDGGRRWPVARKGATARPGARASGAPLARRAVIRPSCNPVRTHPRNSSWYAHPKRRPQSPMEHGESA
ncbi:hypothetical protein GCM10009731_30970 [Streptomyces globosus]